MNQQTKNPVNLARQDGACNQGKKSSPLPSQTNYSTKTGLVSNYGWLTVPRDFTNLHIGATDVDGLIEYHGKAFIFFETKFGSGSMPYGQKLALERLCDATSSTGKKSVVFLTTHQDERIIDMANTTVTSYRYNGNWKPAKREGWTLDDAVSEFILFVDRDPRSGSREGVK